MNGEKLSKSENFIRISFPASVSYLSVLGPCLAAILKMAPEKSEESLPYSLELAVYEACTNIVEHAYKGSRGMLEIILSLESQPQRLIIDLYDTGHSFNLSDVPTPNLDVPQIHGYGLFIVHQLMDDVVYKPETGNNHWRLVKHL